MRAGGSVIEVKDVEEGLLGDLSPHWDWDCERPQRVLGVRRRPALVRGDVPGPVQPEQVALLGPA